MIFSQFDTNINYQSNFVFNIKFMAKINIVNIVLFLVDNMIVLMEHI